LLLQARFNHSRNLAGDFYLKPIAGVVNVHAVDQPA
jgi:hypothetical protein